MIFFFFLLLQGLNALLGIRKEIFSWRTKHDYNNPLLPSEVVRKSYLLFNVVPQVGCNLFVLPQDALCILKSHLITCEFVYRKLSLIVGAGCFTMRTQENFLKIKAGGCCAWVLITVVLISCSFFPQQVLFLFIVLLVAWCWIGFVGHALIALIHY